MRTESESIRPDIRDLLVERSERGTPRGAEAVLAAARSEAAEPVMVERSSVGDHRRRTALLVAAAACIAVAAGWLALGVRTTGEGVTSAGPGEPADTTVTSDPPPVDARTPTFAVPEGQLVPLIALDQPGFRIVGGTQNTWASTEQPDADAVSWAYVNPEVGFGGPWLVIRTVSDRWRLDEGEPVDIGGITGRLAVEGSVAAVQVPVDGVELLVIGVGLDRGAVIAAAGSLSLDATGGPAIGDLPAGLEAVERAVPDPAAQRYGAEFEYRYDRGDGDILIMSGGLFEFQSELLDAMIDAVTVESTQVAGAPAVLVEEGGRSVALWAGGGYIFQLRGDVEPSVMADLASTVRPVSESEWRTVVPEEWVPGSEVEGRVATILSDVPLPAGFDAAALAERTAGGDPYQIVVQATSAVACSWIEIWIEGRESGDQVLVDEAATALATAPDWAALNEIEESGGWTGNLLAYAEAVQGDGIVSAGESVTVEESYVDALGCG